VEEDVLGLDVAVHDALAMGGLKGPRHFAHNAQRLGHRQRAGALEAGPPGLAGNVRHHVVQQPVGRTAVEQGQDVRVLQLGGDLDLGQEALGP